MVMQIKTTMNAMIMTTTVMMLTITDINQKWTLCILGPLFGQIFGQILSIRVKTPIKDTNLVASRLS